VLQGVAVYCSVVQYVALCCSVLQCVSVCCSVLQCDVVCCSVLQCVIACCIYIYIHTYAYFYMHICICMCIYMYVCFKGGVSGLGFRVPGFGFIVRFTVGFRIGCREHEKRCNTLNNNTKRSIPEYCNMLQHANTLQPAATSCNTLQLAKTRCNTLQDAATHSGIATSTTEWQQNTATKRNIATKRTPRRLTTQYNILHRTATHCIPLQHTATYFNATYFFNALQPTATDDNALHQDRDDHNRIQQRDKTADFWKGGK